MCNIIPISFVYTDIKQKKFIYKDGGIIMKKSILVLAAAITLSSTCGSTFVPFTQPATVYASTNNIAQENHLATVFEDEIINNNISYQFNNGVLTVSGSGVADSSYLKTVKADDIKEIVITPGITAIADYAFKGLKNVKKISIPNTVTKLGFYCLSELKMDSIVIPNSVKEIGKCCMANGTINTVTMPGDFTFVADESYNLLDEWYHDIYYNHRIEVLGVEDITPKASVVKLNSGFNPDKMQFFNKAKKVQTWKGDKKYKTYGNNIYTKNGKKLVFVPASTKKLSIRKGCTTVSVNSFTYGSTYEDPYFLYCKNLKSITVPKSVKKVEVDNEINDDLGTLSNIKWKFEAKKIPTNMADALKFVVKSSLKTKRYTVTNKNGMKISKDKYFVKYTGKKKTVKIPKGVKGISPYAFKNTSVKKVILPTSCKEVNNYAFYGAKKLTSVKMHSKIKKIGNYAFYGSGLKKVTLPKNVKEIGVNAFAKSPLTSVKFNKKLTTIGSYAFCDTKLKKVVLPNSVKRCGYYCFADTPITDFTFSNKMTVIPDGMFHGDRLRNTVATFKNLTIPSNIKEIGDSAFVYCNIDTIVIPDSVTKCGDSCFSSTSLSKATLSKNMTAIPAEMFAYCSFLKSITIPNNIKKIGSMAFAQCALTDVVIPDSVVKCGWSCFNANRNLNKITISKSMTSIPKDFCSDTAIKNVIIPGNVKEVEANAFTGKSLSSVILEEGVEYIKAESFYTDVANDLNKITPAPVMVTVPKSLKGIKSDFLAGNMNPNDDKYYSYTFTFSPNKDFSNAKSYTLNTKNTVLDVASLDKSSPLYCKFLYDITTSGVFYSYNTIYTFNK